MSEQKEKSDKPTINDYVNQFNLEYLYRYDSVHDCLYTWKGTHYVRMYDGQLRTWIEQATSGAANNKFRSEFVSKVKCHNNVDPEEIKDFFVDSISGKLNLRNGVFDVKTKKFIDSHSPELGFTSVLPFDYSPTAKSFKFEEFLYSVTKGRGGLIDTLKQFMGYCLMPGYDNMGHYILWLIGGGGNGKSTFMSILKSLVGRSNFSNVTLDLMHNPVHLDKMRYKLINFSAESSDVKIRGRTLNVLKELSSGEDIEVDRKFENTPAMTATAKLIMSTNDMPDIAENQQAMRRRLIPVPFDLDLEGEDKAIVDGGTLDAIKAELPGVLNSVLLAMDGCFKQGRYEIHKGKESQALIHEVLVANDPFESWVENYVQLVPLAEDKKEEKGVIYETLLSSFKEYLTDGDVGGDFKVKVTSAWMAKKLSNKFKSKIVRDRKYLKIDSAKAFQVRVVYGIQLQQAQ